MTKKGILSKLRNNGYAVSVSKRGHFFATKDDLKFSAESLAGLFVKIFGEIEQPIVIPKPPKPKSLKQIQIETKEKVFNKYKGKCAYCGTDLVAGWQIDHINPKVDGGDNEFKNLNPSCRACNNYKSGNKIEIFRIYAKKMFNEKIHYLFRSLSKMQVAMNMGVITHKEWDGIFYFERVKKKV